jgi:outer membrane protein assembly factor BamA
LGLGQTLGLQTLASTIQQRAALSYFIPQFVSKSNLSFTTTALIENSNDIRTFTAHQRQASVQLGQRLSRAYTLQYRLVFRHVTLSNLKIDQLLVPLLSQPETIGMAEVSLIQDKRDDPADAHRGIYSTVDLSYAPGVFAQTHFARALLRNSALSLPAPRRAAFRLPRGSTQEDRLRSAPSRISKPARAILRLDSPWAATPYL